MENHIKAIAFLSAIVAVIFSLQLPCYAQQPDAKSILLGAAAALERHNSVEYTATMKRKSFSSPDTFTCRGVCQMQRIPSDSIYGGKYRYTTIGDTASRDEVTRLYDGHLIYAINSRTKSGTTYDPYHPEKGIESDKSDGLPWRMFLRTKLVKDKANDSVAFIGDKTINGIPCYEVFVKTPDFGSGEDAFKQVQWIYISKKDSIPIFVQDLVKFRKRYQYDELLMEQYTFDRTASIGLSSLIKKTYKIKPFKVEPEKHKVLASGTTAPALSGKVYQNNLDSTFIDYREKVTLLDFWFQDCKWCVKAFPEIEKISDKYKGASFQLIGVNSADNNKEDMDRLPRFFNTHHMSYNTLLVDDGVPISFSVR